MAVIGTPHAVLQCWFMWMTLKRYQKASELLVTLMQQGKGLYEAAEEAERLTAEEKENG